MTIMVTRSKEKHRDRSDISRVHFAEPLVTLHTLRPWETLVGACTGRESTLEAWGEVVVVVGGVSAARVPGGREGGREGAARRGAAGAARVP